MDMTVFLRRGVVPYLNPYVSDRAFHEGELVVIADTVYVCNRDNVIGMIPGTDNNADDALLNPNPAFEFRSAFNNVYFGRHPSAATYTRLCTREQYRGRYSKFIIYNVGDYVTAADILYRCDVECPAGTFPSSPNWYPFDRIGSRFPTWTVGSHNTISFYGIDFGDVPAIYPSTGLRTIDLKSRKIVGETTVQVEDQHPVLRELYGKYGATSMNIIFLASRIHFGVAERPPSDDNPHPAPINMFGMHISVYAYAPPGYANSDTLIRYINPNAAEDDGPQLPDYYQWTANECSYILQSKSDERSDQMLSVLNYGMHPVYEKLMREACRKAQSACVADLSADAFKTYITNQCNANSKPIPTDIMQQYENWRSTVTKAIVVTLADATNEYAAATRQWEDWRFGLRTKLQIALNRCDSIARGRDEEKWINGNCDYSKIVWRFSGKKFILEDIVTQIACVQKLWDLAAADVGGFNTYYLSEIEDRMRQIQDALSCYHSNVVKPSNKKRVKK
jgi:hypothetical protein